MCSELNLLVKTFNQINQISKKAMDFGVGVLIYPAEIHAVERLSQNGPMSVTELAEASGVTKGAMSQMVHKLIKKGLVYREIDEKNQSKHKIILTELGQKAQEGHERFHREHDKVFFDYLGNLSSEEYETFKEFCRQLEKWIHNYQISFFNKSV